MTARIHSFHHIGIATDDLAETSRFVMNAFDVTNKLGPIHDPKLKAELLLLSVAGAGAIELVAGSAVQGVLKKGVMLYHVCYEVDDLDAVLVEQKRAGALVIVPPSPAILFEGRRVSFVHSPIGLIEFLERSKPKE